MAKYLGSGFGQAGFVARMQKQSLFGYEGYGQIESEYSPYAAYGEDAPPQLFNCPDGAAPVRNAETGVWECPTAATPPVFIDFEKDAQWYQVLLALVNQFTSPGSLGDFGKNGSGDITGKWDARSKAAWEKYAANTGTSGSVDTWNTLGYEVRERPEQNDPAYSEFIKKVNTKPAGGGGGGSAGGSGSGRTLQEKANTANKQTMLVVGSLVIAGVLVAVAMSAKRRN